MIAGSQEEGCLLLWDGGWLRVSETAAAISRGSQQSRAAVRLKERESEAKGSKDPRLTAAAGAAVAGESVRKACFPTGFPHQANHRPSSLDHQGLRRPLCLRGPGTSRSMHRQAYVALRQPVAGSTFSRRLPLMHPS